MLNCSIEDRRFIRRLEKLDELGETRDTFFSLPSRRNCIFMKGRRMRRPMSSNYLARQTQRETESMVRITESMVRITKSMRLKQLMKEARFPT